MLAVKNYKVTVYSEEVVELKQIAAVVMSEKFVCFYKQLGDGVLPTAIFPTAVITSIVEY